MVASTEVSSTRTPHLQGRITFRRASRLKALTKLGLLVHAGVRVGPAGIGGAQGPSKNTARGAAAAGRGVGGSGSSALTAEGQRICIHDHCIRSQSDLVITT